MTETPLWFKRDLSIGDSGPDVKVVQRKLGLDPTGLFDRALEERVKGMTTKITGTPEAGVSASVAKMLGETETNRAGVTPVWYKRELGPKDMFSASGEDVRMVRSRMGLDHADDRYDPQLEAAVRRFQSYHGLTPDGVIDEKLAILIGD